MYGIIQSQRHISVEIKGGNRMKKFRKLSIALGLVLCLTVFLSSSVFATTYYSRCPRCGFTSLTETTKTQNVGDMIVTSCSHGYSHQKDVIQNTQVTHTTQCNRCVWFNDESYSSSYLVGHLLYTD